MTQARPVAEQRSRIAAAVYGTILVLAVLSYLSEDHDLGRGDIAAAMVGTGFVYFAAHVYVDYLAARMTSERGESPALLRQVLADEWPLLQAMIAPGIPLVLGAFGLYSRSTGVTIALCVALADLVGWGYTAGRRTYGTWLGGVGSALIAVALGLVVVGLKSLLH